MADRLTLDTSVLLEYWKDQPKRTVVEELLQRQRAGVVELAVTARIREDVPKKPLASEIDALPQLGIMETGSVTRLGYWVLGRDHLGSAALNDAVEQAVSVMDRKPDWRDIDHLHAHVLQGRDVFLTWDRSLLELGGRLAEAFGVRVMRPEDYLAATDEGAS